MKVLLVDGDLAFRRLVSLALSEASIDHEQAQTAADALRTLARGRHREFDLLLVGQELSGCKGTDLLLRLRRHGIRTPVVLVSPCAEVAERIRALDMGADDCLVKPVEFGELVARMRAVLRRSQSTQALRAGNVELDPLRRRASLGGEPMDLTAREFDVLLLLLQAHGRAVPRAEFLRRIWDLDFEPETNSLQVHISRLRRKLGNRGAAHIETIRGGSYRVVTDDQRTPPRAPGEPDARQEHSGFSRRE